MFLPNARERFVIFPTRIKQYATLSEHKIYDFFNGNLKNILWKLAGAAGFEPTDAEIKTRCLTTWRRPYSDCTMSSTGELVKLLVTYPGYGA